MSTQTAPQIVGTDEVGTIAETGGFRYYLTSCCAASTTGSIAGGVPAVVCRECYTEVDSRLGGIPAAPVADPTAGLATMSDLAIVEEMRRAEVAADTAKATGNRDAKIREHRRLVAVIGEFATRGYILDAASTRVGARVQSTATDRIGTVSACHITGEITVDWGTIQVSGFPNSRYNTFRTDILATGALKVADAN